MFTIDETQTDNILVRQKDRIIKLVNDGKLNEAFAALNVVREFWYTVDYGYKIVEIEKRIADREQWDAQAIVRNEA